MKEIGGYLELDNFIDNEYYKNYLKFNLSRKCLDFIVEKRNIKKIFLPYFLCDSVKPECNIEKYNINKDFMPALEIIPKENEYVYIVNYYGQITNDIIIMLKNKYKNIIVDNVQAFFQEAIPGVDTIYSCRKFFGVSDGAYLSTSLDIDNLKTDKSYDRLSHVLGRYENSGNKFYSSYKENEEKLNKSGILKMSKITHNILKAIDYEKIKLIRNNNYKILYDNLKNNNLLNLKLVESPYAYPLLVKNGNKLRELLISKKIYIPILWPNILQEDKDTLEYNYAYNILPIPCDQRYSEKDMLEIIKIIEEELKCI